MRIMALLRAAVPFAAIVLAAPALAQAPQGVAYSPGVKFDFLSWKAFIAAASPAFVGPGAPAMFETWATNADTFSTNPRWPTGPTAAAMMAGTSQASSRFHASNLGRAHLPQGLRASPAPTPAQPMSVTSVLGCAAPGAPGPGNFPTPANPPTANCIAEEVRRNHAAWDFIVKGGYNTQAGLAAAYGKDIQFTDTTSMELKADWAPIGTVAAWLNNNGVKINGQPVTADFVRANYFLTRDSGVEYALLAMHISTKDLPNWLWATFEHQMNPGRCDTMGCFDRYGIIPALAAIPPRAAANTQYPTCQKSDTLGTEFAQAGLAIVFRNYCLKATQIDFVSTQPLTKGRPVIDGNSLIERINAGVPIASSSCIGCHSGAAFAKNGAPGTNFPDPGPRQPTPPGYTAFDFVWSILAAP